MILYCIILRTLVLVAGGGQHVHGDGRHRLRHATLPGKATITHNNNKEMILIIMIMIIIAQ